MAVGKDLVKAQEMEEIAKSKGVRTVVGLQAWQSPFVSKIKEIVESGQTGKVLSTTFIGNPGFRPQRTRICSIHPGSEDWWKHGDNLLHTLYVPLRTFNTCPNPNLICSL
jgi:predicted dehydrogenase